MNHVDIVRVRVVGGVRRRVWTTNPKDHQRWTKRHDDEAIGIGIQVNGVDDDTNERCAGDDRAWIARDVSTFDDDAV